MNENINELRDEDLENVSGGTADFSNCKFNCDGNTKIYTDSNGASTYVGECANMNTSVCESCCCKGDCCNNGDHYATTSGTAVHEPMFWMKAHAQ